MKKQNPIVFIIVVAIIIVAGVFLFSKQPNSKQPTSNPPSGITVQDKQITDNTKPFVIKINYPDISGMDDFNKKALDIINNKLSDFKTSSLSNDEAVKKIDPVSYAKFPREYDLNIGYDKGEIDDNAISFVFNVYNFEGGAHGESYFIPLNYNPKTKKDITLADLFPNQKGYLQTISDYCTKDLTKQMTAKLGSLDGTWLADGVGPKAENFQNFLINKNNIVFYFSQYQVAYGAAGDFTVTMPR